jgi:hypothetical protein
VGGFPTSTETGSDLEGVARAAKIAALTDLLSLFSHELPKRFAMGGNRTGRLF